jgi:hypothetical protein
MRNTVTRTFRQTIALTFPGLHLNISYWLFMLYLIFGHKDVLTGLPLIDGFHIAKANNQVLAFRNNNHIGKKFLEDFQKDVMTPKTFTWSGWSQKDKRARVAYVKFPPHILELIEIEMYTTATKDKVYFVTGKKVVDNLRKVQREMIKKEAETYFEFAIPEAKPLLTYMNNLSVHNFSKVITKNFDAAFLKVLQIEDPLKSRTQIEILLVLRDDLQPFYKPSHRGCTPRIFPCNYSIPMLRKDIRKVLTKGWYEFDLANAQLAIVTKLWSIQHVHNFLSTHQSIWSELFRHFGFNQKELRKNNELKYNAIKDVFKTSLYSLIYGMPKGNLVKEINQGLKHLGISFGGRHYFNHPLIESLYQAREAKFKEMNNLTNAQTIFGKTLPILGSKTVKGTATKDRHDSISSLLAHQAQAVELYLLLPVVDLAKTTKDFYITLWQHDGFSVHFTDNSKVDYWIKKIQAVVQQKINEQDILTHLDWELL